MENGIRDYILNVSAYVSAYVNLWCLDLRERKIKETVSLDEKGWSLYIV